MLTTYGYCILNNAFWKRTLFEFLFFYWAFKFYISHTVKNLYPKNVMSGFNPCFYFCINYFIFSKRRFLDIFPVLYFLYIPVCPEYDFLLIIVYNLNKSIQIILCSISGPIKFIFYYIKTSSHSQFNSCSKNVQTMK